MKRLALFALAVGCGSSGETSTPSEDVGVEAASDSAAPIETGVDAGVDGAVDVAPDAAFVHAPNVNAMRDGTTLLPLYPSKAGFVAFRRGASDVTALREDGTTLWTAKVREGSLFGGFDADGDGVPDLGVAAREGAGETCGTTAMQSTWLELHSGATGALFAATTKTKDLCWTFGTTVYPTQQWTDLGVLFGPESKTLALLPYYASIGQYATWSGASFAYDELDYPSTAAFDAYTAAKTNAYGTGKHTTNPHVANGLILKVGTEPRLLFFTSSRVVQYAIGSRSLGQLRVDHPFLTAGRTDLVGRDYGLVARDPGDEGLVVLLSGTSSQSVFADLVSGKMEADPWGQIERHVTVYDPSTDALDDRFYSYAHDGGDANKYEGRVVYPDHPFLRRSGRSRLIYDVYAGGHWWLHVSQPGSTADAWTKRGVFVWDVRDLDGDGVDEIVSSTVEDPTDPDVAGYYFPKFRTVLSHLSTDEKSLVPVKTFEGAIPELVPFFRDAKRTTSYSALYPVLTVSDGGRPKLVLRKPDGTRLFVDP